ncbi:MAG: dihydroorotate dehydrogenase electron transfer subunit [Planctomycetales bacterium]|nr:dihydroorotate dehydrogenase electron transfer subunit [Planctomycetales bacterium]
MTCFADHAQAVVTPIVDNECIARDTMRLRISVPAMAQRVLPGQFFMLRNPAGNDPLIGRAFALYDVASEYAAGAEGGWLDLVYLVKGKLTSSLVKLRAGDAVAVWGPLGNGFAPEPCQHLIMVAGGIGQTPFVALAKEALGQQKFGAGPQRPAGYASRVSLCYGVRSAEHLAGVEQFEAAGVEVHIATEDGSLGPPRRVTDTLVELLRSCEGQAMRMVCCGPEPMMEAVADIAAERDIACQVSLETPMACGIGICFTCVAKVGTADDWDYKRTCVEGPVFNAREILWH